MRNQLKTCTNQLLENFKQEWFILDLKIISGVLIYKQLISKFNKGFRFLLCVFDIFSKYAWVVPLKDKKDVTITNAFQEVLKESKERRQSHSKGCKQTKYGLMRKVNFTIVLFKND